MPKKLFSSLFALLFVPLFSSGQEAHANKSGVEPSVLSLPQGPGSLGGVGDNVQANLNMGLMSYAVRIVVPRGRGTATPDPSISYSSSAGSGTVGIGWNFSAGSSIERSTVRGLPTYTNDDAFYAGGEIVKIPNSPFYRSRYEGSFMRYRWIQKDAADQRGYWLAESPDGSKMYYGADEKGTLDLDAQVYGLKGTFRWELTAYVDRNGNKVSYSYFKEGAQTYPDQIAWVFDDSGKALYHLKFGYEARPDHVSDGKPGFDLQLTKRLKEVQLTSNGQRFRSYHLDFEDATGLSRLIKITQYGRDPAKAYPVQFTMKYSDATFSPENSRMVQMPTALGVDFRTNNIDFLDINGDGLPDVVETAKSNHVFFLNQLTLTPTLQQNTHDFPRALAIQNPTETSAPLSNPSVQMLDYDGDGFTDLVDAVNKKIYVNKGNTRWENQSANLQSFPVTGTDPNMRFFDYNGDKAIDVISSDGNTTTYWVSDGKGMWKVIPGQTNIGLGFQKDRMRLIDINGDGLQDIVHITKDAMRYRKYLGYGEWTEWINVKVPGLDQYELSTQAQFADINGDGMADMVAFLGNSIVYFVNKNGTEFSAGQKLQTFKGIDIPDSTQTTVRIADMNGNGSRDIVWIDSSGKITYLELFSQRPNLMTSISNAIGQRINVEYGSSAYFALRDGVCDKAKDAACGGPWQNKMPMPFTVVTKITTWASRTDKPTEQGQPTTEEKPTAQAIYYHDGFYDGEEKRFRGFRQVESLRIGDDSAETLVESITYDVGEKDPYLHGKMLRRIASNDKGRTYNEESMIWKECPLTGVPANLDPPVRFICLESSERLVKEGEDDPSRWKTLRQEMQYDGFGNTLVSTNLGDKNTDGDEQIIKTTYITPKDPASPDSVWQLRLEQKIESCNKTEPLCAERSFYYDGPAFEGLPAGNFTKGNLSRISARVEAGKDAVIHISRLEYDTYGNRIGLKTARGLLRTVEWDNVYHHFATKETILLGDLKMEISSSWDYSLSLQTKSTSINGENVFYTYDDFGRLTSIRRSEDAPDKPSATFTYEMKAPLSRIVTQRRTTTNGPLDIYSVQCFDGLGRPLAAANRLKEGSFLVSNHRTYNVRGTEARRWKTYTSATDCQFEPPVSQKPTQTFYDALSRVSKFIFEDGSFSRKEYAPLRILDFDPEDNRQGSPHFNTPTIQIADGLGRVIERIETLSGGKTIATKYEHTNLQMLGQSLLKSVTFADGSKKSHTYDLMGRVRKVEDPDRSTITYTPDDEGNTIERLESNGNKILSSYDLLNRILTREHDGKPETKISFSYDLPQQTLADATFTKGQITQITFPTGSYNYSYDINGNLDRATYIINGQSFAFSARYDNLNRLLEETFPDGRKLAYERDITGRLLKIPGQIDAITYSADTTPQTVTFANGIQTTYAFDGRQRLQSIDVGGGKVMQIAYTLDSVGNITAMEHQHSGPRFTHRYTTDALYRLTKAELGDEPQEEITYTYDDLHNTLSRISSLGEKSPIHLGNFSYDPKQIHAVRQAGKRALTYDANGSMTQDGDLTYLWDFLKRRVQIKKGEAVVGRTWYGPNAERHIKEEDGLHTFSITPKYEIREGRAIIYTSLGSNRVVAWSSPKGAMQIYRDLAPATGDSTLTSQPDGHLNAADAWLFHAARQKLVTLDLPKQTHDLDYTKDYLQASLARMLDGSDEQTHYYHPDHLGSIRAVTDGKGAVVVRKDFYPYGFPRRAEGDLFSFGFQGTERDALSGANYFSNRFLDTHLGRWISADPLFEQIQGTEDEFNSYGLSQANPVNHRDLSGTESEKHTASAMDYAAFAAAAAIGAWELYKNVKAYRKAGANDGFTASEKKNIRTASVASGILTGIGLIAAGVAVTQQAWKGGYDGDLAQSIAGVAISLAILADSASTAISLRSNIRRANEIQKSYVGGLTGRDKLKIGASVTGSVLLLLASAAGAANGTAQMNTFGQEGKFWVAALTIAGAGATFAGIAAKMTKGGLQNAERSGKAEPTVRFRRNSTSYAMEIHKGGEVVSGAKTKTNYVRPSSPKKH